MRIRTAVLLVPVLLALCVGSAAAKTEPPQHHGLDRSYGRNGTTTVAVPDDLPITDFAVAAVGRTYALRGTLLLAFQADGKVARSFGKNGRITVASTMGAGDPTAMTVDSQGRILLAGWASSVYVIRLLPNGKRDPGFGDGGEVDTNFGLPLPPTEPEPWTMTRSITSIAADSQDRPIVAGSFPHETCEAVSGPFVARLTSSGEPDAGFAGTGYALPAGPGEVTALGVTHDGGVATLSDNMFCGAMAFSDEPSRLSAFTEAGAPSPSFDPSRPTFYPPPTMAIDPKGRLLLANESILMRLGQNGDLDTGFGQNGGVALTAGLTNVGPAFAIDANGRPILAGGKDRIELRRLGTTGKIDKNFGPRGRLTAKGSPADAIALDAHGRIYTASAVESSSLKTGFGIEVARFTPGG